MRKRGPPPKGPNSLAAGAINLFCSAAIIAAIAYYWPEKLALPAPAIPQNIEVLDGRPIVYMVNRDLVGELAEFNDGFFAYLMFDYYRSQAALEQRHVMLISDDRAQQTLYRILVRLPNDLIGGIEELAALKAERLTSVVQFNWITADELARDFHQTAVFMESYAGEAPATLESLHGLELEAYLRRFIRFKSVTDPRIHGDLGPIPSPLTQKEASRLAADMIAVSQFYGIPLDLLIGIGAMENNFMSVPGDPTNTIWKRRAQPGDIILRRRRRRVLVRNDSAGVWQITRESLRYAHRLYLADKRDYTQLPPRLRPPKQLDMNDVNQDVLTTYAGLLLRDLLDRFHGDATLAVGAYNGGFRSPNARYAAGVEVVADYARRMIDRAAELNHRAVSETSVNQRAIEAKPQ
ncbi:MAG TPA: hypothetical protein VGL97_16680 [Bryobacteraceae bacterium]|jgi:hypothetical protein